MEKKILQARILIVDDQDVMVSLLEQMLRTAHYACVSSTLISSEVAALHEANHYDLILLDIQMPDMDGFEVMEQLRKCEPSGTLPVLVISAQPNHKPRAIRSGANDFISKPFDVPEILSRVHNMLESRLLGAWSRGPALVLTS